MVCTVRVCGRVQSISPAMVIQMLIPITRCRWCETFAGGASGTGACALCCRHQPRCPNGYDKVISCFLILIRIARPPCQKLLQPTSCATVWAITVWVVSDDIGMHAMDRFFDDADAAPRFLEAGNDILMICAHFNRYRPDHRAGRGHAASPEG